MAILIVSGSFAPIVKAEGQLNPISVHVNGSAVPMTATPYVDQGVTMVPFRAIFEALNLKIDWDKKSRTVTGWNAYTRIELKVGSLAAKVNGNQTMMQTPAEIKDGAVYVPLRFVGEETGNRVTWHAAARNIDIQAGNTMKGQVYTADGKGYSSGKHVQLLKLNGNELLSVAEAVTGPKGDFHFVGLENGSDYYVQGSWSENADIVTCAFKFRLSGNCAWLGSDDRHATVRVLSPDGNPIIDNEMGFDVSENGMVTSFMAQQQTEYVTDLLQDGRTYTITARLSQALSERYAIPASYTFTYHAGDKVKHEFVLANLPDAQVTGRLIDDTGKPIAGIRVSFSPKSGSSDHEAVVTKQDGSFSLRGLEKGHTYWFNVFVPIPKRWETGEPAIGDFMPPSLREFTYDGSPLAMGNVKLYRIQLIAKVVDGNGKPQSGLALLQDANGKNTGQSFFTGKGYVAAGGMTEGESYTWKVLIGDFVHNDGSTRVISTSESIYSFIFKPGLEAHTFTGN
ncbi:stalk domain-containing protein [Paenibacillus lignilyticus]|uniref:Copper amine oxidase-like N-terminal domain-containing protein n=1 Tax=Paenibacillus lignilyticus TaxID=1172615 RepID=A0ABS5CMQ4_9BACL|nr:stalk domain-containing protein [Paenibacillus lignilyticus]MBP3967145.1 hypothetical protein [Paenibacillus lignilyticus]